MYRLRRRTVLLLIIFISVSGGIFTFLGSGSDQTPSDPIVQILEPGFFRTRFKWRDLNQHYPVRDFLTLPTGKAVQIPKIQYDFPHVETSDQINERNKRCIAVKDAFVHSWKGYRAHAWLKDELHPLSGGSGNPFGGWGATLVDSLDTLWIMGLKKEFEEAVAAVSKIDFRVVDASRLNLFETTIRFLGGLLGAYDVSGHKYSILLRKAVELGDMLYMAFDTPYRMPVARWEWKSALLGNEQIPQSRCSLAEIGSLSLEFTRLAQLTNDHRWYDAITRITRVFEASQNNTRIPGLWPTYVNALSADFTVDTQFTLGGMADSMYEYLPKQYLLLGGQEDQYRTMYLRALDAMKENLFFQPLSNHTRRMLITGSITAKLSHDKKTTMEHLSCFAGGMVALAAKIFQQPSELQTAEELLEGCIWAGDSMASGIVPETFTASSCPAKSRNSCTWNEQKWLRAVFSHNFNRRQDEEADGSRIAREDRLPPGFLEISDSRYNLRPEVIESVFVLYRITGDQRFYQIAWKLFQDIETATRTSIAHTAVRDVRDKHPKQLDAMESFWTAETLKYFYLIFSDPGLISLDDYVFNTEAHPLLRPK